MVVSAMLSVSVDRFVPSFIRERFVARFLATVFMIVLLVGLAGALGFVQASDIVEDNAEEQMKSTATLQADSISSWISEQKQQTKSIAGTEAVRQGTTDDVRQYFTVSSRSFKFSVVISVDAANGTIEAVTGGSGAEGASLEEVDTPWARPSVFEKASGPQRVHVGNETFVRPMGEERLVYFVIPAFSGSDRFIVTVASLTDQVEGLYQPLDGQSTTITRADGEPIVSSGTGIVDMPESPSTTVDGNATFVQGDSRVFATSAVEGVHWYVVSEAPKSAAFSVADAVGKTVATIIGISLLGLIIVAVALGRQTVRPLTRLRSKVTQMADGDLDVAVETDRVDEIGELYQGVATMRNSLKDRISEAEQARKEAEVSRAEAMEMNEYLQDKAEEYSEIMQACARGDLTQRMDQDGESEPMDRIAAEFNEMVEEIEMTTGQLKSFASEVEEGGQSLQRSAETVRNASEQVAESVQKISDDAYNQKERLQSLAEEIDDVAATLEAYSEDHDVDIDDGLARIRRVTATIEKAADLGEEMMTESETVAGAAEEQAAELNDVKARSEELTRYAKYLGDGLGNFQTDQEHEFVFQTGASGPTDD